MPVNHQTEMAACVSLCYLQPFSFSDAERGKEMRGDRKQARGKSRRLISSK